MDNRRSQPIRIVIADDHPIFRDGLRRLLEAESDLKVIGEREDACESFSQRESITRQEHLCALGLKVSRILAAE